MIDSWFERLVIVEGAMIARYAFVLVSLKFDKLNWFLWKTIFVETVWRWQIFDVNVLYALNKQWDGGFLNLLEMCVKFGNIQISVSVENVNLGLFKTCLTNAKVSNPLCWEMRKMGIHFERETLHSTTWNTWSFTCAFLWTKQY